MSFHKSYKSEERLIMKKNLRRSMELVVLTLVFAVLVIFCSVLTVKSREHLSAAEQEAYYRELEDKLVSDTRKYLEIHGIHNSGIMLTRVLEDDGSRDYTMTIHHRDIENMTGEQQMVLCGELQTLVFESENCSFRHKFSFD